MTTTIPPIYTLSEDDLRRILVAYTEQYDQRVRGDGSAAGAALAAIRAILVTVAADYGLPAAPRRLRPVKSEAQP